MRIDEKQGQSYILTGQKAIFPKLFQLDKCVKGSLLKLIKLNKTQNTDLGSTVVSNRGNRSTLIFVHMILLHRFFRVQVGLEPK